MIVVLQGASVYAIGVWALMAPPLGGHAGGAIGLNITGIVKLAAAQCVWASSALTFIRLGTVQTGVGVGVGAAEELALALALAEALAEADGLALADALGEALELGDADGGGVGVGMFAIMPLRLG